MQIRHRIPFIRGYTPLSDRAGLGAEMLMDFGVLKLDEGESYQDASAVDERIWLLSEGAAIVSWEGQSAEISRPDLFDYSPWCLSVPSGSPVAIKAGKGGCEFYRCATDNPRPIKSRLYTPGECRSEFRGEGTMRETSTRIVRTIFDDTNRPESNLVIGEVIGLPGRWSSYPPHHHPQPEIYHYRFLPAQGFGLTAIGTTPYIIKDRDTIFIKDGEDHPQVTAPGYAMWYLWVIRHIEGNHYGKQYVTEDHQWVTGPEDRIWQPKR
ncbi:MAG: 5-deoxy-glucuronate isomerase [Treponema sp.]|jgi:5-deoxy-glucuronate isomerase|nr:5-deoxy-glucuronate isomerase [Treponema sp.]